MAAPIRLVMEKTRPMKGMDSSRADVKPKA